MSNYSLLSICFLVLLISACQERTYQFTTTDFGKYYDIKSPDSISQVVNLQHFNEGIYVFEICKTERVFGDELTNWYGNCDSICINNDSIVQYTFLAFLDDYRVLYYTYYEDKLRQDSLKNINNNRSQKYLKEISHEENYSDLSSDINQKYSYIQRRFDINYDTWKYSMRGYYKIEYDEIEKDYMVKIKMEKIVGKKKIKMMKDPGKMFNKKNHFVELFFKFDPSSQALIMDQFRIEDKFRASSNKERKMVYRAEKEFESAPVYKPISYPVQFYFCNSTYDTRCPDEDRTYITDISYEFEDNEVKIIYRNNNEVVWDKSSPSILGW